MKSEPIKTSKSKLGPYKLSTVLEQSSMLKGLTEDMMNRKRKVQRKEKVQPEGQELEDLQIETQKT